MIPFFRKTSNRMLPVLLFRHNNLRIGKSKLTAFLFGVKRCEIFCYLSFKGFVKFIENEDVFHNTRQAQLVTEQPNALK